MLNWKSDPLIVLRVWESQAHGEATGPETLCSRKHHPHSEVGRDVNDTGQNSTISKRVP